MAGLKFFLNECLPFVTKKTSCRANCRAVGIGYKCAELGYEGPSSAEVVADYIESVLKGFGVKVIGKMVGRGNPPCLSCGAGETCNYSNVIRIWGKGARITPDKFQSD